MDSGVGSFVFSLGIISALPILKRTPINLSLSLDIWQSSKKTIPLLVLGLIRILFVKGVDYPEHVTEYGVHWNFFFTLALLPVVGVLARRVYEVYRINLALVGILLSLVFQCVLSLCGLQEYVLSSAPRTGLIAANREGLASLPGYVIIYLFGLSTGCYILPTTPDFLKKLSNGVPPSKLKTPRPGKSLIVYVSWAVIWWTLYFLFDVFVSAPSRRLANPTYCFWIVANNLMLISGHYAVQHATRNHQVALSSSEVPQTFDAINRNSLAGFLVANLMTGVINLSVQTMYLSDPGALLILLIYSSLMVLFCWKTRSYSLKL